MSMNIFSPPPAATVTCTRRVEFDAAHRVVDHESKCKFVHGHRYVVEATFAAEAGLDALGRVIDFGEVRRVLGEWIDAHWDHTAILWQEDRALGEAVAAQTGQAIYYLPYNPTVENLALYLLQSICPQLFAASGVRCVAVKIWETPNCSAVAVA